MQKQDRYCSMCDRSSGCVSPASATYSVSLVIQVLVRARTHQRAS
jgi:hypothetical protein